MQSKVQGMLRPPPPRLCISGAAQQSTVLIPRLSNRSKMQRRKKKTATVPRKHILQTFWNSSWFSFSFPPSLPLPLTDVWLREYAATQACTKSLCLFPNIFKKITALGLMLRIYSLYLLYASIHLSFLFPPRSFLWKLPR